jgi:hypothetical protein
LLAEHGRDDDQGSGGVRGRSRLEEQPLTLLQRPYTVEEARAERFDTPDLAENGPSTAAYAYQIGLSGDPEKVVWTKTNAGDPSCS